MPEDFTEFEPASFGGLVFPWKKRRVRGGLRDHVHEVPHSPGGKPEKMGRRLYTFEFEVPAYSKSVDPKYATLWPGRIGKLREKFENQETDDLHVPGIGTIKAYCYEWDQDGDSAKRNGEDCSWHFREDQSEKNLIVLSKLSPASMGLQSEKLQELAAQAGAPNLFDQIAEAVDDVLAIRDQATLRATLLESKLNYISYLCGEADRTVDLFTDPSSWPVLDALKDLWASSKELAANFTQEAGTLRMYTVPSRTTVSAIAKAIYGDSSRGMDILQLNALDDPFEVRAGTKIRYFVEE